MTSATKTSAFLKDAFRRERRALTGMDLRRLLAGWAALLASILALDAAMPLSMSGLFAAQWMLLLAATLGLAWVAARFLARRFQPERVALAAQRRIGVPHDRLINALELSRETHPSTSRGLRDLAVRLAEELAGELDPKGLVPDRRVKRSWKHFLLFTGALALLVALWPAPFRAAARRLNDPAADHPPYTRLRFEISVTPDPLYVGRDARLLVEIEGPAPPAAAQLMIRRGDEPLQRVDLYALPAPESDTAAFRLDLKQLESGFEYAVDTPEGRSDWHRLDLLPVPLFEEVHAAFRYPDYTGWPDNTERLKDASLRALEGTRAELTFTSNLPLSHGELRFIPAEGPEETLRLEPLANPRQAEGGLTLERDGVYAVRLIAADGTPGETLWEGTVTAVPDLPPRVTLELPEMETVAPAGWTVEVPLSAEDDVAIASASLRVRVDGRETVVRPVSIDPGRADRTRLRGFEPLPLDDLGVLPGATLRYFVEACDNKPPHGQCASSRMAVLNVVTPEEYRNLARTQYRAEEVLREILEVRRELERLKQDRQALLDELDSLRESFPPGAEPSTEQAARVRQIQQQLDQYRNHTGELTVWIDNRLAFDTLYAFEEPYREWLEEMRDGLNGQTRDAGGLSEAWNPDPALPPWNEAFDTAVETFRANTAPFPPDAPVPGEQLEMDFENLEQIADLLLQTQRLRDLADRQRELAEKLDMLEGESAEDPASRARMRELAREQEELRRELDQIRERMRSLSTEMAGPMPELAAEAAKLGGVMDGLEIPPDQSGAADAAGRGEAPAAEALASRAADKLEQLAQAAEAAAGACSGSGGSCSSLSPSQFAQSIEQMLRAMRASPSSGPPGMTPSLSVGGSGMGMGGMMSTLGMVGPQYPFRGGNMSGFEMPGRSLGDGPGRGDVTEIADDPAGPGTVTPDTTLADPASATASPGVPAHYRPLVEAYFERLAKDRVRE